MILRGSHRLGLTHQGTVDYPEINMLGFLLLGYHWQEVLSNFRSMMFLWHFDVSIKDEVYTCELKIFGALDIMVLPDFTGLTDLDSWYININTWIPLMTRLAHWQLLVAQRCQFVDSSVLNFQFAWDTFYFIPLGLLNQHKEKIFFKLLEHSPENRCPLICSRLNSTRPSQFSTHPTQNAIALVSGRVSVWLYLQFSLLGIGLY